MIEIKRAKNATECPQKPANDRQTGETSPETTPARKRELLPFTGMDAARDYRAMYRAAFAFHEAHNPPTVDREYWRTHTPGFDDPPQAELDYWQHAAEDLSKTGAECGSDPFFIGLILAVYDELEREYKAARSAAADNQNGAKCGQNVVQKTAENKTNSAQNAHQKRGA